MVPHHCSIKDQRGVGFSQLPNGEGFGGQVKCCARLPVLRERASCLWLLVLVFTTKCLLVLLLRPAPPQQCLHPVVGCTSCSAAQLARFGQSPLNRHLTYNSQFAHELYSIAYCVRLQLVALLVAMQVGHFGLFVDATLDTGMSRPCATYAK